MRTKTWNSAPIAILRYAFRGPARAWREEMQRRKRPPTPAEHALLHVIELLETEPEALARATIIAAFAAHGGVRERVAEALEIPIRTLYSKLETDELLRKAIEHAHGPTSRG